MQKCQFYVIPFTFISSLYNHYQLLDVPSAVSCAEILWCEYYERFSKFFSLIGNLKILELLKLLVISNIRYNVFRLLKEDSVPWSE